MMKDRPLIVEKASKASEPLEAWIYARFVAGWVALGLALSLPAYGEENEKLDTAKKADVLEDYTDEIEGHLVKFKMVAIPAGSVNLPDPQNPGETIEKKVGPFFISQTTITWNNYGIYAFGLDGVAGEDYDAETRPTLARRSADYPLDEGWGWDKRPAIGMTYQAAEAYTRWLSKKTGRKYRLPTEAEWVYACLAGEESGVKLDPETLAERAWFKGNSEEKTQPVGELKPNAFGVHDMLGNVAEWAVGVDGRRVVLGGSFQTEAEDLSCVYRQVENEDAWQGFQFPRSPWWFTDAPFIGIRVVSEPEEKGE